MVVLACSGCVFPHLGESSSDFDSEIMGEEEQVATLVLDDGTHLKGKLFGAAVSVPGEVGKCVQNIITVISK